MVVRHARVMIVMKISPLPLCFSNLFHFATAKVSESVVVSDRFQWGTGETMRRAREWFGDMEQHILSIGYGR